MDTPDFFKNVVAAALVITASDHIEYLSPEVKSIEVAFYQRTLFRDSADPLLCGL
jgi:hypothetical protein